jgi:hypothetical protein
MRRAACWGLKACGAKISCWYLCENDAAKVCIVFDCADIYGCWVPPNASGGSPAFLELVPSINLGEWHVAVSGHVAPI